MKKQSEFCNSCNKDMVSEDGEHLMIGFKCSFINKSNVLEDSFIKKQFGVYDPYKVYAICYECWFKAMGIKP